MDLKVDLSGSKAEGQEDALMRSEQWSRAMARHCSFGDSTSRPRHSLADHMQSIHHVVKP